MQTILVLNLGSTSFKYELFEAVDLESLKRGEYKMTTDKISEASALDQQLDVNQEMVDKIFRNVLREVGDVSEIKVIGHRVVHGGDKYLETTRIGFKEIEELEKLNELAPLHNPFNLAGIKSAVKYLPEVPNYAVFDTTFFVTLPDYAKIYPLPYKYFLDAGIHKFGFHGISHKFAAEEAARRQKLDFNQAKIISIHLGGGCSMAAINKGKAIDVSMGFTPLEGLMMQTRAGDIDAGVITQMFTDLARLNPDITVAKAVEKINHILNYQSGIKGIAGKDDFVELLDAVNFSEPRAKLAFEMFIYRIKKYLGAYYAILDGLDTLVFTGQIGAGKPLTRKKICDKMKILAEVPIEVVETHEELGIAREIKNKI